MNIEYNKSEFNTHTHIQTILSSNELENNQFSYLSYFPLNNFRIFKKFIYKYLNICYILN